MIKQRANFASFFESNLLVLRHIRENQESEEYEADPGISLAQEIIDEDGGDDVPANGQNSQKEERSCKVHDDYLL